MLHNSRSSSRSPGACGTGAGLVASQILIIALLCFIPIFSSASEEIKTIQFVLSGDADVYERIADSASRIVKETCTSDNLQCSDISFGRKLSSDPTAQSNSPATLRVLLGTRAANLGSAYFRDEIRINAMIPYSYRTNDGSQVSSNAHDLYIDQPFHRYFELIRQTIPLAKRVGILVYEGNTPNIQTIEHIAKAKNFLIKTGIVNEERDVGEALARMIDNIDVLLALPDSRIHNSKTISHILTTSYRNNIPVIGFSSAYVKAGATTAVYTSPENIGAQLADSILEVIRNPNASKQSHLAKYFSVTFNYEVARSLGLPTISTREIHKLISASEDQ